MIVLDHPGINPTAEQTDEQSRAALAKTMGNRAQTAWALTGMDPLATAKIYPTAYHIKVAVRDSSVFWLSSGNWNDSNQPDIDPFNNPKAAAPIAKKSDRDWHAIVEHAGLSKIFEAYLQHDYSIAKDNNAPNPVPPEPLPNKNKASHQQVESSLDKRVPPTAQAQFFKPFLIKNEKVMVQPVLTPDNYVKNMLPLIQSAKQKLYIQTQYIHPSKKPDDLQRLLLAVKDKMKAGLDVRIILSEFEGTPGLDALKAMEIDTSLVRLQNGVHNKGFVVDSQIVALGSQNWSDQGAQTNRDATLIIRHEGAAKYFEQIFIHDWTQMAKPSIKV
jgi:PLD-like domain